MKIIGIMNAHNGIDFIEYSVRSTAPHCDRYIIIEGAWGENIMANGKPRSTDGTIEIIQSLMKEFPQIELHTINKRNQLEQRSEVFNILANEPAEYWLWLIDHDEIYDNVNIARMIGHLQTTADDCLKVNSLTFINDFWHKVEIAWPRLFRIEPDKSYIFCEPNHLLRNGKRTPVESIEDDVFYYHYSYCHTPERFLEKRRERMLLHGQFKWRLDNNGMVIAPGTNIVEFKGEHPEIMTKHPLYNRGKI